MSPATKTPGLILALVLSALLAGSAGAAGLVADELPRSSWEGLQFLDADGKGRVFVLDGDKLMVHRLSSDGLDQGFALEPAAGFEQLGFVLAASMGKTAGDWLVRTGTFETRLFRGREEKPLPPTPFLVQEVLIADGSPVVAVAPIQAPTAVADRGDTSPLLLGLAGQEWYPLMVNEEDLDPDFSSTDTAKRLAAQRRARWKLTRALAADAEGRIWVADRHLLRLQELTESGRLRTLLTIGRNPTMEIVERSAEEREAMAEAAAEEGRKLDQAAPWLMEKPKKTILGLTVAGDGLVYVAMPGQDGVWLGRWDPMRLSFEQTLIAGLEAAADSILDVVAGRDGLYFAERAGDGGRWLLTWEALRTEAEWEAPEQTVYLDGQPLVEVTPPQREPATSTP